MMTVLFLAALNLAPVSTPPEDVCVPLEMLGPLADTLDPEFCGRTHFSEQVGPQGVHVPDQDDLLSCGECTDKYERIWREKYDQVKALQACWRWYETEVLKRTWI
jgi:hypothetical protein